MGKNIYTLKFDEPNSMEEMIDSLAKALDNKYPIVHHENEDVDLIIEETKMVLGSYESAINNLGITGLVDLNSRVTEMYQRQAKYILQNISEKTGNTEYIGMITDSENHINGEKFKELFKELAYNKDTNDLLIDNAKTYFKKSSEIDTYENLDEEMVESDEKIISYSVNWYHKDEEERKNNALPGALSAFGYSIDDFDNILENINKSNNPKKEIIDAFKKHVSQKMNEFSDLEKTENNFFDIQMKFSSALKIYSSIKMDYDPTKYLKEYITKDKDYKAFGFSLVNKDFVLNDAKYDFANAVGIDEDHIFDEISIDDAVEASREQFSAIFGLSKDNIFYNEPIDENNPPKKGFRNFNDKLIENPADEAIILPADMEKGIPERTKYADTKIINRAIDIENSKIHANNIRVYENAISKIKNLEEIHKKRGYFTRFFDWFRSNGEASTISKMKKHLAENLPKDLIKEGYSGKKIDEDIRKESLDSFSYKNAIVQIKHLESFRDAEKERNNIETVKEINDNISKYKNILYGKGFSNSQINKDIKNADLRKLLFYGVDQSIAMLNNSEKDEMPYITIDASEKIIDIQYKKFENQDQSPSKDETIEKVAQEDRRELSDEEKSALLDDISEKSDNYEVEDSNIKVIHVSNDELDNEDEDSYEYEEDLFSNDL